MRRHASHLALRIGLGALHRPHESTDDEATPRAAPLLPAVGDRPGVVTQPSRLECRRGIEPGQALASWEMPPEVEVASDVSTLPPLPSADFFSHWSQGMFQRPPAPFHDWTVVPPVFS